MSEVTSTAPNSQDQLIESLFSEGIVLEKEGKSVDAIEKFTRIIETPAISTGQMTRALVNRAYLFENLGKSDEAFSDYTNAINLPGASPGRIAYGMLGRARIYNAKREPHNTVEELTKLLQIADLRIDDMVGALLLRGKTVKWHWKHEDAIPDFTRIIDLPLSGENADSVAEALIERGHSYLRLRPCQLSNARNDLTKATELAGVSPGYIANALNIRASSYDYYNDKDEEALADRNKAIALEGVPPHIRAKSYLDRALSFASFEQYEEAIADLTHLIELPGAPLMLTYRALEERADIYGAYRKPHEAIADYTTVLEKTDPPINTVLRMLLNRAANYRAIGKIKEAKCDYTEVIELDEERGS